MKNPIKWVLAAPRAWLAGLMLLTLALVPVCARLRLDGNVIDLLPRSSPAAQSFADFTRGLVAGQELIILVVGEDPQRLTDFADRYAAALSKLPDAGQVSYRVSGEAIGYLRDHLLLLLNEEEQAELRRRLQPEAMRQQVRRLRGLLSAPGGGALAPLLTADPLELVPLISHRLQSGLPVDAQSGYFRTSDGKALLLKLRPGFNPMDWGRDRRLHTEASRLARSLGARVADETTKGGAPGRLATSATPTVAFTGAYAFAPYYRLWLEQDLSRSTTLSLVAVLLLFALFFRAVPLWRLLLLTAPPLLLWAFAASRDSTALLLSAQGLLILILLYAVRILPAVLLSLGAAGVWTTAAAVLIYGRVNGVSLAFGTILVAIGIDLPIQLYNRLREELLRAPGDPQAAVRRTVLVLTGPAVLATLGPAAVFLCCGLSDYRGLNELGVLAAVGLCLNCVAMLTLFPCLLLVLPARYWHSATTTAADAARAAQGGGAILWLGRALTRRPAWVLAAGVVLAVIALPLAARLSFAPQLFSVTPQQMPPTVAQEEIARRFGDRQRFLAVVLEDTDPDRALYRGDLWAREAERLRGAGQLRGYEGLSTLVPSPRTQAERRAALGQLRLPAAADELGRILDEEGFTASSFAGFLDLLRRPSGAQTLSLEGLRRTELGFLVSSHVADLPAGDGKPARRMVAIYLFAPADERIEPVVAALQKVAAGEAGGTLTGVPLLEPEFRGILRRDITVVTAASVALVAALLILYYRRWRPTVAVLVPLALSWVLFAAAMHLCRIPLNLYNLLAIPLCIGYGIDDHVFLVHRHEAEPAATRDPARTLDTTGRAIVLTSLSTMAGFAALLVAHFEGLRLLGLSGALAVLLCLFSAFAILPALLALLWRPPTPPDQTR